MGSSSLSGPSSSLGQYAASYPSNTQYSSQSYGQPLSSSPMGSFSMQQGSTQVNAQVGQFKVPSTQTFSVPAGYSAPQSQYSSYGAATQPSYGSASQPYSASQSYTAPSSNYQQYSTSQTAPQASSSVRSASLGASSMGSNTFGSSANYGSMGSNNYGSSMGSAMGLPTQYSAQYPSYSAQTSQPTYSAQNSQYSAQTQYPTPYQSAQQQQQPYSNYGMGMGMGSTSQPSSGSQTSTQQVGVRTMYVPLNQVQQILSQYPGAQMVGTVTANQIPAGASVY